MAMDNCTTCFGNYARLRNSGLGLDLDLPSIVCSLQTPGHIVTQKRGTYVFLLGTKRSLFAKVLPVPFF